MPSLALESGIKSFIPVKSKNDLSKFLYILDKNYYCLKNLSLK